MSRTERMVLQTSQPKARLPSLFSPACTFHQMSDADFLTASSQVGQLLFLEVSLGAERFCGALACALLVLW